MPDAEGVLAVINVRAMAFAQLSANIQAQTCSSTAGGEEGLEQGAFGVGRDGLAIAQNGEHQHALRVDM